MHDLKNMRQNPEKYQQAMVDRGDDPDVIPAVLFLDEISRAYKTIEQERQVKLNRLPAEYAALKGHVFQKEIIQHMQNIIDLDTLIADNWIRVAVMDGALPERIKIIMDQFKAGVWEELK